jgi:uncharacterized protein (TIGR03083 family)
VPDGSAPALTAAREGYAVTVERYAQLIESVADTSIAIPDSEWTVRDASAHLAGGTHRMTALAEGESSTVPRVDKEFLAERARRLIGEIPETDGAKLAGRIREGLARAMAVTATRSGDQPISFYGGLQLNLAELVCLYLGEYLLHGYDVAVALGMPWPIDPGYAALAVSGFRPCYPGIFTPACADGLDVTYQLDTAGTDPFFVRISEATCERSAATGPVDCVITADSVTQLLVMSGRLNQWTAIALGRLTFSGQRPEIGLRFNDLFIFP